MTGQTVYLDPATACDAMERILIAIRNVRDEHGLRCLCVIPEDYVFSGMPATEFFSKMLNYITGDTYLWPQEYIDMVANFVPLEQRVWPMVKDNVTSTQATPSTDAHDAPTERGP